jgi:nitrogen regulatory protein PII
MKLVVAIIRPGKVPDVTEALRDEGVNGFSATEVMGCGNQWGRTESEKNSTVESNLIRKTKVEFEVEEPAVSTVVARIVGACRTGRIGDGKIFVFDVRESTVV